MLSVFLVSDHSNLPEIVNKVLIQEMQKIFISKDLESFNEEFLKRNSTSIQHLLSGWFVLMFVKLSQTLDMTTLDFSYSVDYSGWYKAFSKECGFLNKSLMKV